MRLIDADALIEFMDFCVGEGLKKDCADILKTAVTGAPTVEPPAKCIVNVTVDTEKLLERLDALPLAAEHPKCWIPVGERLPENSEPVLVTYHWLQDSYEVLIGEYWGKTTEECPEEEKGWGRYGDHVTAWMPLPKPYKGGEDE